MERYSIKRERDMLIRCIQTISEYNLLTMNETKELKRAVEDMPE